MLDSGKGGEGVGVGEAKGQLILTRRKQSVRMRRKQSAEAIEESGKTQKSADQKDERRHSRLAGRRTVE